MKSFLGGLCLDLEGLASQAPNIAFMVRVLKNLLGRGVLSVLRAVILVCIRY